MFEFEKKKELTVDERRAIVLKKAQKWLAKNGTVLHTDGMENVPSPVMAWSVSSGTWFVPASALAAYEEAYRAVSV